MPTDHSNAELSTATQRRKDCGDNALRRLFMQRNWTGHSLSTWIAFAIVFILAMTPVAIPSVLTSFNHNESDWLPLQAAAGNKLVSGISSSESYFLVGWSDSSTAASERADLLSQKLLVLKSSEGWPWFPRVMDLSDEGSAKTNVLAVTLSPKLGDSDESLEEAIGLTKEIALQECGFTAAEIHLGGPAIENLAVRKQAITIISLLVPLSMIACFGLHYLLTKQARISLLLGLIACTTSAITFALVYYAKLIDWSLFGQNRVWLGEPDVLLLILPAILFSFTFAAGSQLVAHFQLNQINYGNLPAPWKMLRQNWKALLLSSLLSIFCVLAMLAGDFVPLQRFSIFLAIGILVGTTLLMTLLPMLLDFLASIGLSPRKRKEDPALLLEDGIDWGSGFYREALVVGLILIFVVGLSFPFANRNIEFTSLLIPSSQVAKDQAWFLEEVDQPATLYANQNTELQHEATRTLALTVTVSLIAIACLLVARTQNNRLVFAILAPTIFTIIAVMGITKFLNWPIGIGSVLAVAFGMTITMSQTLHYRNWMQLVSDLATNDKDLIKRSSLRSMPANLVASAVLFVSMVPFGISAFAPVQEFGFVTLIWMPTSIVAVGILFPAAWLFVQPSDQEKANNPAEELAIKLLPPPHWFDEPKPTATNISQLVEEEQQQALEEILSILESTDHVDDSIDQGDLEYLPSESDPPKIYEWQAEEELEDADNEALRQRLRRFRRGA